MEPARRGQGAARPLQVLQAGGVIDVDPLPRRGRCVCPHAVDRDAALGADEVRDPGMAHRLKGVDAKNALGHRLSVDVVYPFPGAPADLRIGRQEWQGLFPAGPQQGSQLGPYIAPQGRIGLFIDVRHLLRHSLSHDLFHDGGSLGRGQMPGLGIDDQHLGFGRAPKREGGVGHHPGVCAAAGQLDAGVQRARKVVCNDQ